MNDSLSIILPAYNAQQALSREVEQILDVAPELTSRFDLLVIDDGSHDATEETACELAARFSQVFLARHRSRLGWAETIRTALRRTDGDYLLIRHAEQPLQADRLPRLWRLRSETRFEPSPAGVPGALGTASPSRVGWLDRLMKWGQALQASQGVQGAASGFRLFRRDELAALQLKLRDGEERVARPHEPALPRMIPAPPQARPAAAVAHVVPKPLMPLPGAAPADRQRIG